MTQVNFLNQAIKKFFANEKVISEKSVWALWSRIGWQMSWNFRLSPYYLLGGRHELIETENFYFLDTRPFYGIKWIQTLAKVSPTALSIVCIAVFLIAIYQTVSFSLQDLSIVKVLFASIAFVFLLVGFGIAFLYLDFYYSGYSIAVLPKTKFSLSGQKLLSLTGSTVDLAELPLIAYIQPKTRWQKMERNACVFMIGLLVTIIGRRTFEYVIVNN